MTTVPSPDPFRLGFHLADGGATIAIYAPYANGLELCLFDDAGAETRVSLAGPTAGIWHAFVPDVMAGQLYGLRASGEWDPAEGHLFNPSKLLLDPYARGIEGTLAGELDDGFEAFLSRDDTADSAHVVPRGVLLADPDRGLVAPRPRVAWEDTVIYEAHVRGLTMNLPDVPEDIRGTYAALGHASTIAHLTELGATSLELLPIHTSGDEPHLERLGLTNYWGYSTLGFFAPHAAYASQAAQESGAQGSLTNCARPLTRFTARASRFCSTLSTTTPPRAAREGVTSRGGDWPTAVTTDTRPAPPARSMTRQGPGTRSTSVSRAWSRWRSTRFAIG